MFYMHDGVLNASRDFIHGRIYNACPRIGKSRSLGPPASDLPADRLGHGPHPLHQVGKLIGQQRLFPVALGQFR